MDLFADVKEFHAKFGIGYDGLPRFLEDADLLKFRLDFIEEELKEFKLSHDAGLAALKLNEPEHVKLHLEDCLDAAADLTWVTLGLADVMGLPFNEAWKRVYQANMTKVKATDASQSKRGYIGDIIKPPGWKAPSHIDLVSRNAYNGE